VSIASIPIAHLGASSQLGGFVRVPPFFCSLNADAMNERILSESEIEALRKHWATAPTIDEAAKRLGVCRDTARYWARKLGLVRPNTNPWTPELTERLVALTKAGDSGSAIAAKLGVTRSAVIGKVHRLGMQLGNCRNGNGQIRTGRPQKPVLTSFNKYRKPKVKSKPEFQKAPIPPPNINDIGRVKFSELEPHHCRFGVGDPKDEDFKFCGLDRIPGRPYCSGHTARAYVGLPPKKPRTSSQNREKGRVMA